MSLWPDTAHYAPMPAQRILIVDDEAHIRNVMSSILARAGYEVAAADSVRQALDLVAAEQPFDIVLSDIMMAGADGLSLLDHLHRQNPYRLVIMVTAVHDISVAMAAIRCGAYDYLLKPFEREQLLAIVRRALDHVEVQRQNEMYKNNLEQLVTARTNMLRDAMNDLERSYDITLEALGDALDLRDAETEGHSKRVTAYTIALARALGMGAAQLRVIARGAFLHDIGKIAIPDAILLKPGKLSPEEMEQMRQHCTRGYEMIRKIPFLTDAAEIVHCHQERFDGSGYPRGLRGSQIPLGARAFALADTLDAITSERPYRPARDFESARTEIDRCAGSQFDPDIVKVFLSLPLDLWRDLRGEINSKTSSFTPIVFPG